MKKKAGFGAWLRNNFFAGIVVVTPIAVTVLLMVTLVTFVDARVGALIDWVDGLFPERDLRQWLLPVVFPGLGVVLALVAITVLGILARNIFGRYIIGLGERILDYVPLVRSIYGPIKQILETLFRDQGESFKEVALVEYPKEGTWALCFVTATAKGAIEQSLHEITDDEHVAVFIPTTPNPTSGFLLYVPRSKLKSVEMSVEDGARAIISFGIVTNKDENGGANGHKAARAVPTSDQIPSSTVDGADATSSPGPQETDGPPGVKQIEQKS